MVATTAASTAPTMPPTSRLSPRWLASWAAVKAPTPANVAWANESWPPMPVIRVMERKMTEKASPSLNTNVQVGGIQVSMETMNAAEQQVPEAADDPVELRARSVAMVGGTGGSTEASGSFMSSRPRMPGTMSRATISTMKGTE